MSKTVHIYLSIPYETYKNENEIIDAVKSAKLYVLKFLSGENILYDFPVESCYYNEKTGDLIEFCFSAAANKNSLGTNGVVIPNNADKSMYLLAYNIQNMSLADAVFFMPGYENDPSCVFEYTIACTYEKPVELCPGAADMISFGVGNEMKDNVMEDLSFKSEVIDKDE